MRILIITSESLPGSEGRNLPLAAELIRRGHEVRHTGPSTAMAQTGFSGTTFEPEFAQSDLARACNTELFETWGRLKRLIAWAQVVVLSTAKGYLEAAEYSKDLSKILIWQLEGSFHPWIWNADLVTVPGRFEQDRVRAMIDPTGWERPAPCSGWPRLEPVNWLRPENVRITGSLVYDQACPLDKKKARENFYDLYGLDPAKKLAVWLPSSPACHADWFKELYRRICASVEEEAGFNLVIKPHPRDYAGTKQEAYYEDALTPTWEQLAPGVKVCRPQDKWDGFKAADVLLTAWSTAAIEAGLVQTPMLLVDTLAFTLEIIRLGGENLKKMLPRTRFSPASRRTLGQMEPLLEALRGRVDPQTWSDLEVCREAENRFFPAGKPDYIGTDCTLEELPGVLAQGGYEFNDEQAYEEFAEEYAAGIDGRAYLRMADLVESVEADPGLRAKLDKAGSGLNRLMVQSSISLRSNKNKVTARLKTTLNKDGERRLRILIITGESLPGSEGRNLPLARELIGRGHLVRHTGPARKMSEQGFTSTTFEPGFPGEEEARACGTVLFDSWAQLRKMIRWAEVVLISTAKGYQEVIEYAADLSKVIVTQMDHSFHTWIWRTDLLIVPGQYDKRRLETVSAVRDRPDFGCPFISLPQPMPWLRPEMIRASGSVLFDQSVPRKGSLDKAGFFKKYGLNPDKRLAVWLPPAPASHSEWLKELYIQICRIVTREAGFNLIIKPHPRDYSRSKQASTYEDAETPTWEQLAPEVPVSEPEDKWDCFRAADVLLSTWTTAAVEAAFVRRPVLLVDSQKFLLEILGLFESSLKDQLPLREAPPPGLSKLSRTFGLVETLAGRVDSEVRQRLLSCHEADKAFFKAGFPEYIGTECSREELAHILKEGRYQVGENGVFDDFAQRYAHGNDGQAYLRIAGLVESVGTVPALKDKLKNARSQTLRLQVGLNRTYKAGKIKVSNRLTGGR